MVKTLDGGINFFNTADAYAGGQSEEMLGGALGARRKDVVIATKVGFRTGKDLIHTGLSRRHIIASAEGSLRRLATDYIDVFPVHRQDPVTPLKERSNHWTFWCVRGKVRYIGFSNWQTWMAAKAVGIQQAHGRERFRAGEIYYSLIGRDLEHEMVPFAEDAGIGIMVWSPITGGFLTGKYTREDPTGGGGRLTGFDFIPFDREWGFKVVECLVEIAASLKAKPSQVALAWLLSRKQVASVLPGASKLGQLLDNIGAADLKLEPDVLKSLDERTAQAKPYPNWYNEKTGDGEVTAALS